MCMFRFPEPDFERCFYLELFGVELDDIDVLPDLDPRFDTSNELLKALDALARSEPAIAG
jgi:hypothetical protein